MENTNKKIFKLESPELRAEIYYLPHVVIIMFLTIFIYILFNRIRIFKYFDEIKSKAKSEGIFFYLDNIYEPVSSRKERNKFMLKWSSEIGENESDKKIYDKSKIHQFIINDSKIIFLMFLLIFYIVVFIFIQPLYFLELSEKSKV